MPIKKTIIYLLSESNKCTILLQTEAKRTGWYKFQKVTNVNNYVKNARSKCHCALMMQWKFHPRCDLESLFYVPFLAFFVILGNNFVSKCPTLEYRIICANTIINTQKNYTQEHGVNTGFVSWPVENYGQQGMKLYLTFRCISLKRFFA